MEEDTWKNIDRTFPQNMKPAQKRFKGGKIIPDTGLSWHHRVSPLLSSYQTPLKVGLKKENSCTFKSFSQLPLLMIGPMMVSLAYGLPALSAALFWIWKSNLSLRKPLRGPGQSRKWESREGWKVKGEMRRPLGEVSSQGVQYLAGRWQRRLDTAHSFIHKRGFY